MAQRLLIIETSHQPGCVALAEGDRLLSERKLDQARRHARDLAPAVKELLDQRGWRARDLEGVIVSRGPGSYTGLRVGLMSAKTLAYATGCRLLTIETFAALARQAPLEAAGVDVVADAQQDKLYAQRFGRVPGTPTWQALTPLAVVPAAEWLLRPWSDNLGAAWVTGPGVELLQGRLRANLRVVENRNPQATSLLALGWERWQREERDDPFAVEPLYLRPSSAEEKLAARSAEQ